jgi:hypothetical protein
VGRGKSFRPVILGGRELFFQCYLWLKILDRFKWFIFLLFPTIIIGMANIV